MVVECRRCDGMAGATREGPACEGVGGSGLSADVDACGGGAGLEDGSANSGRRCSSSLFSLG